MSIANTEDRIISCGGRECEHDVIRSPFIIRGVASSVIERTSALHPNTRLCQFNVAPGRGNVSMFIHINLFDTDSRSYFLNLSKTVKIVVRIA